MAGTFQSNGAGERLSRAALFKPGSVLVIGRFALAGGMPALPDGPKAVRSFALSFRPEGGGEWRTGMNDIPVFPVNTPQAFEEQLLASKPDPASGKPDPAAMKAFLARHPETAGAIKEIMATPFSTGFANARYNSLDAFRFINAAGVETAVRWSLEPVDAFIAETPDQAAEADKNYLFDALGKRIWQSAAQWHLVATIAKPGDPTNDATIAWPQDRERVDLGLVNINHI